MSDWYIEYASRYIVIERKAMPGSAGRPGLRASSARWREPAADGALRRARGRVGCELGLGLG
ncbi:hypothetical protein, partial [Mycobacterium marinum]|uniref:hypothetical protein n=1 Tax=Mycobacterium marinum TaxID=1781 RepID=UPI0021C41A37